MPGCLTTEAIDVAAVLEAVERPSAGAVVLFLGTVRDHSGDRATTALSYEAYGEMAERLIEALLAEAAGRWPLTACRVVHRLGRLAVGEVSVAVAVSAPHREAAFAAGQWLIDTLKQRVPIWKQENFADGTSLWVHPHSEIGDTT
jgi:molybdopterin synthase catalytic subunit